MPYDSLFGAILVGGVATAVLYGVLCLQCLSFFQRNACEPKFLKTSVGMLWVLSSCHLVVICQTLYVNLVKNFGSLVTLVGIQWSTPAIVLLTACTSLLVHCWYCHRVWTLSEKSAIITYPLLVMIVIAFAFTIASFLQLCLYATLKEFQHKQWPSYVAIACVTTVDICIAVALCYFLLKHRRGVRPQTSSFVNTLIAYTVSTGMLTSIAAVGYVITSLIWPRTYIWWAIYFVLSELYANSFMAWLNAREHFRRTLDDQSSDPTIEVTSMRFAQSMLFMDSASESDDARSVSNTGNSTWSDGRKAGTRATPIFPETFQHRRPQRRQSL